MNSVVEVSRKNNIVSAVTCKLQETLEASTNATSISATSIVAVKLFVTMA